MKNGIDSRRYVWIVIGPTLQRWYDAPSADNCTLDERRRALTGSFLFSYPDLDDPSAVMFNGVRVGQYQSELKRQTRAATNGSAIDPTAHYVHEAVVAAALALDAADAALVSMVLWLYCAKNIPSTKRVNYVYYYNFFRHRVSGVFGRFSGTAYGLFRAGPRPEKAILLNL